MRDSLFFHIPQEVLVDVVSYLDVEHVVALGCTCRWAQQFCRGGHWRLWLLLLNRLTLESFASTQLAKLLEWESCESLIQAGDERSQAVSLSALRSPQNDTPPSLSPELASDDENASASRRLTTSSELDAKIGIKTLQHQFESQLYGTLLGAMRSFSSLLSSSSSTPRSVIVSPTEWPKYLACRFFAFGFERLSSQVRVFSPLFRGTGRNIQGRWARVVEYFLLLLSFQQTFLTTNICDLEAMQEVSTNFASCQTVLQALEILKYFVKSSRSKHALQLYEESNCIADALATATLLSEISDHPSAQSKYDSLWAAHRASLAELSHHHHNGHGHHHHHPSSDAVEKNLQELESSSGSPLSSSSSSSTKDVIIPLASEYYAVLTPAQSLRLHCIGNVLVSDLIAYFLRISKSERKSFCSNTRSLYRLTVSSGSPMNE